MIPSQAHLDPRFKAFANLREDEYESILAVPIVAAGQARGRAQRAHARRRGSSRRARSTCCSRSPPRSRRSIEHAQLYAQAQRRVGELEALAKISEAVSESLYLEESLEAIVKTTMDAVGATGAALVLEDGKIAWPEGRAGAYAVRLPLRWKRRVIGELVCDRDTPFTDEDRALLGVDRAPRGGGARARPGRHARRPGPGDPPPRQEQPPDGRLAAAPAGARERRRAAAGARGLGQPHPRDRRRPRGAHRAAATRRSTSHELLDRLRSMLVQGLGAEKYGRDRARARSRSPATRRPPWRSSSASCCRTRSSTAATASGSSSRSGTTRSCSRSPTTAAGSRGESGHRPLDRAGARPRRARRRARPSLEGDGLRAEVVFPP